MPVRDYICKACNQVEQDVYMRHAEDPPPVCPACGGDREQMVSRFAVVFTGPLTARYNDPNRENAHMEGFWAYAKRSTPDGQPQATFIDTWDKLRAFNKAEGLSAPGEVPTNCTISADGRRIISNGMPGQWSGGYCPDMIPSGVWRATKSLTSLSGRNPEPKASGPECTVEAVPASMMEKFEAEAGRTE